jgi:hypothetical protein
VATDLSSDSRASRSWVFQANPDIFDLEALLATRPHETRWLVNQFKDDVRAGDRVYLWLSGPRAGLVAVAHTISDPSILPQAPKDAEFTLQPERLASDALRVSLAIDDVLDPPLPKQAFTRDPVLRQATIIRAPYQTNFQLTTEQDEAIGALIAGRDPWVGAIRLCRELLEDRARFDAEERDYKLEISERVILAMGLAKAPSGDLIDALKRVLAPPNNLLDWRTAAAFRSWVSSEPTDAAAALRELEQPGSPAERVDRFDERLPDDVGAYPGARLALASLFLMGIEPTRMPMFRATPFAVVERRLGWEAVHDGSLGAQYESHLAFAEEFSRRLGEAGVAVRDMLDVQGLLWWLGKSDLPNIVEWRGETSVADTEVDEDVGATVAALPSANISHANGILAEIADAEPVSLSELLERGDPERLFKSDRELASPRGRAQALVRLAKGLALLQPTGDLALTELGRAYIEAGDPSDPFAVTDGQARILRDAIEATSTPSAIGWGAALALSLWKTADDAESVHLGGFGRALALAGGVTQWNEEQTFYTQGRAYTALLTESKLLDAQRQVTAEGDALLQTVPLPAHPSLAELLAQVGPAALVVSEQPGAERVWWVNQGDTYVWSRDHNLLWAPRLDKAGRPKNHWTRLTEAQVGDRVLHYSGGSIRAVGTVTSQAVDEPRPSGFPNQGAWNNDGWRLSVHCQELAQPLALREIPSTWCTPTAGPFTSTGIVLQGYFLPVSSEFAAKLAAQFSQLGLNVVAADPIPGVNYVEPDFASIVARIIEGGLRLDEQTIRRYHLSLRTRGFVILSGLSGSGKTALASR